MKNLLNQKIGSPGFCKENIRHTLIVIFLFVIVLISLGMYQHARGLIAGALSACFDFYLMNFTVLSIDPNDPDKSIRRMRIAIFPRYFVLAVPLIVAFEYETVNIITAVLGLYSVRLILLIKYVILFKKSNEKND